MTHLFPYRWHLKDGFPAEGIKKHDSKVFSCFAGAGGSSMGYKLAGYDVIGCNEIDKKMLDVYQENLSPKHVFDDMIQDLKNKDDLPNELYNLDILDGSPPCSQFSVAASKVRGKYWGKKKKFAEGQIEQVLDTLFFDFIDLVDRLQPKIVVTENVKGILIGNAATYQVNYVDDIYSAFDRAGYICQHRVLNSAKMGVPQKRERVIFIALRKDLIEQHISKYKDIFKKTPFIDLQFNEPVIKYKAFKSLEGNFNLTDYEKDRLSKAIKTDKSINDINQREYDKISRFGAKIIKDHDIFNTITASDCFYRFSDKSRVPIQDYILAGSFPLDYDFLDYNPKYMIGMSVPPVMMAQISYRIYQQWLSKMQ